jgi:hypothetical protein
VDLVVWSTLDLVICKKGLTWTLACCTSSLQALEACFQVCCPLIFTFFLYRYLLVLAWNIFVSSFYLVILLFEFPLAICCSFLSCYQLVDSTLSSCWPFVPFSKYLLFLSTLSLGVCCSFYRVTWYLLLLSTFSLGTCCYFLPCH